MYQKTTIDLKQLRKATKPFNLNGRDIYLFAYGQTIRITSYLESHFDKLRKNADKPEYIEYINQHFEIEKYLLSLGSKK
jgi:hypothetical protein